MNRHSNNGLLPWWQVVLLDILAIGICLCIFSLFHHVLPKDGGGSKQSIVNVGQGSGSGSGTTSVSTPAPAQTAGAQTAQEPVQTSAPVGDFSAAFEAAGDITGEHDYTYSDDNIRIAVDKITGENSDGNPVAYFVADIWIRNIQYFKTAFANDTYGQGYKAEHLDMAQGNNALVAISGDYYGARSSGIVIRNGELYRDTLFEDVCVLFADGTMETYEKGQFDMDEAIQKGAYQAWSFGPMLLQNGEAMTEFNCSVNPANPRSSLGYYEPGHYCFVVVDGRQDGYSNGLSTTDMSKLYADLGCKTAYNLDGGQTAMMSFEGKLVNQPYGGGRGSSDIVYIGK